MRNGLCARQTGMTLIEILVSVLILAIGLLGAAALQLNALKYTDSSTLSSQASFVAYDMMDRIRANPDADYRLASLASAPSAGNLNTPKIQDLFDFSNNIKTFAGPSGDGSIAVTNRQVTVSVIWNDSRATNKAGTMQTFTVTSRVAIDAKVVTP
ncbi:type IV pilus modification protein PilV [Pseudomonas huanghezhanensis]|uniref:type IV pilus modification protein PilV n=1 Tax=Pseudomonas huanghezhanensis TaxID=3002903 RepID=UPI0022859689|nr:type IV pilus modification protein PilV [Pseudomonas sp. BSw22131]